jgi:hypothetical protein
MPRREYKNTCEREWMPIDQMAHSFVGVAPDLLRAAINAGELDAYEKPITRKRTGTTRENHSYFVCREDVSKWIRTHWKKAVRV